jgi:hypothetical protein
VKENIEAASIWKSKRQSIFNTTGKTVHDSEDQGRDEKLLIFQRMVGHKEEMPGSGQWKILTEKGDQCWICDKHIYSLIFWSPSIGHSMQIDLDDGEKNRIISQIEIINHENEMEESGPPLICGSFTDWRYKSMMTLDAYLKIIDK